MRRRIGLVAAAAAAAAVLAPLAAGTSAHAAGEWHTQGVYYTYDQCQAAGVAGYHLWGPNFLCQSSAGYVYLLVH
ncbi:hypothetical protein [Streptomyces sp. NRRL F-5123]|uniref:hypothetical protein n=1 Tax=Streptomyces sp. NRRL F-5123 TaxID=1463856 RepID=UPI0006939C7A|nr:hypothetical protein [Streptomyces sp. NRRL F-5123]